jgi:hypothetical protein
VFFALDAMLRTGLTTFRASFADAFVADHSAAVERAAIGS